MSSEWKLSSNCANYAVWLEDELGERRLAFQVLDAILYSTRYGGAHKLCQGCPVRDQCLEDALSMARQIGWWGNLSPKEREGLVRKMESQVEIPVPEIAVTLLESERALVELLETV